MPLRLDVKRKLLARSDRVKSTDLHPTEPWMLVSLYNGNVHIWNYDTQALVKSFEVHPVNQSCQSIDRIGVRPAGALRQVHRAQVVDRVRQRRHARARLQLQHHGARAPVRGALRLHAVRAID